MSTGLSSVLLAGGGSAGHVSPLLALADCLRRSDPDVRITALGTETGLEQRLVPARGYPLRTIPKVAFPRRPTTDLARLPASMRGAVLAAGAAIDEVGAEVVVGFGGYVSTPAYLAARRRRHPDRRPRAELPARAGQPAGRTHDAARRDDVRLDGAAPRDRGRHAAAPRDRPARPRRPARRGARPLRAVRRPAHAAGHRRVAGRAAAQHHVRRSASRRCERPACRCSTSAGWARSSTRAVTRPRPPTSSSRTSTAWTWPTPPPTVVVARSGANTVCELTAVGLPAVYVPLPIGNGEQRVNAADVVAAGGGVLVDDGEVTPAWVDTRAAPSARRRAAAGGHGRGRCRRGRARGRRAAGRHGPLRSARTRGSRGEHAQHALRLQLPTSRRRRRWDGCTSSPSAAPGCPVSRG